MSTEWPIGGASRRDILRGAGVPAEVALATGSATQPRDFDDTTRCVAAQAANDPSWNSREIATGHHAMITAPEALAKLLLEAVMVSG